VVDYGSTDNLEEMLQELNSPLIKYAYIDKTPVNRSHGNNIAIVNTDASLVCVTDGNYIFQDNFVQAIFDNAIPDAILTCTARPIVIPQVYVESDEVDVVEKLDEVLKKPGVGPGPLRGSTYVLVMDREAVLRIRGYDEDLLFSEDIDMLRRMLVAGALLVRLDKNTAVAYQSMKVDSEEKKVLGKQEQQNLRYSDAMAAYRRKSPMRNLNREFGKL